MTCFKASLALYALWTMADTVVLVFGEALYDALTIFLFEGNVVTLVVQKLSLLETLNDLKYSQDC